MTYFRPAAGLAAVILASWIVKPCAAETYRVDNTHSSLMFRIKHLNTAYFYGRFNQLGGTMTLESGSAGGDSFQIEVNAESVDTGNAQRDTHLKGPDFFNAKQFPAIRFKSTKVTKNGPSSYAVTGDLTLHGVTKPIEIEVFGTGEGRNPRGQSILGVETTFTIKRSDFGMNYMVGPLGDEVRISVGIEAVRQ